MKKIICFTFLVIIIADLSAQSNLLRKYYYWTNKAELAICDNNYQKASDYYEKAFAFHRPFSKDAFFAFKVNYRYLNNIERCLDCYMYLAQMGDKAEWYVDDTVANYNLWKQLERISDTTKCLVNQNLANALKTIQESDQEVRWQQYDDNEAAFSAYRVVDSMNLIKIKEIYKTYPEISDYTAGGSPILSAFYTHVCRTFLFDPKTILLKDVLNGNIPADQYALNEDLWKCICIDPQLGKVRTTIYGTNVYYVFEIDSLAFFLEPDNIKKINRERRKIGLSETWDDLVKKAKFVYTHDTEFKFIPRYSMFYLPEEAATEMEKWVNAINTGERKGYYVVIPEELRK